MKEYTDETQSEIHCLAAIFHCGGRRDECCRDVAVERRCSRHIRRRPTDRLSTRPGLAGAVPHPVWRLSRPRRLARQNAWAPAWTRALGEMAGDDAGRTRTISPARTAVNFMPPFKQPCAYLVWVTRGTPARVLLYPSRNLKMGTPRNDRDCNETTGVTP